MGRGRACWAATAWLVLAGGDELGHHDVVLEQSTWPWSARIGAFLGVWLVMVGAMMLPTVVPLARLFEPVSGRAPRPRGGQGGLLAGYLAIWTAFAGIALLGDAGIHASSTGGSGSPPGPSWCWAGRSCSPGPSSSAR